ncbi:MAG: type II secretion system protein GspC [Bacteriovoracia bacterium]
MAPDFNQIKSRVSATARNLGHKLGSGAKAATSVVQRGVAAVSARFRKGGAAPTADADSPQGTGPRFNVADLSTRIRDLGDRFTTRIRDFNIKDLAKTHPKVYQTVGRGLEYAYDKVKASVDKRGVSFYGKAITIVLTTYFLADLPSLYIERLIPEPPVVHDTGGAADGRAQRELSDYEVIFSRNLFNSRGLIPDEGSGEAGDPNGVATPTTLPFDLIGTLILRDDRRSLATIMDRTDQKVYPVMVEDEIPGKAKITKVESIRVTFVNLRTRRNEFVALPDDQIVINPRNTRPAPTGTGKNRIEKVGENRVVVAKAEVDEQLADFNRVITQARAVPNYENGVQDGYKLFQIVPGSIYEKLGIENGDVIRGINGDPMTDPGKAFELLNELRGGGLTHAELNVRRNGKDQTLVIDIQ